MPSSGHCRSDSFTETESDQKVSVDMAPPQLMSDKLIATGQAPPDPHGSGQET
jgi:hypothetical protein